MPATQPSQLPAAPGLPALFAYIANNYPENEPATLTEKPKNPMKTILIEPKPEEFFNSHRQHTLTNLTPDHIDTVLGFRGDHESDASKVVNEWRFTADGVPCAIWDYKGSHNIGQFSAWGPHEVFHALFPGRIES